MRDCCNVLAYRCQTFFKSTFLLQNFWLPGKTKKTLPELLHLLQIFHMTVLSQPYPCILECTVTQVGGIVRHAGRRHGTRRHNSLKVNS